MIAILAALLLTPVHANDFTPAPEFAALVRAAADPRGAAEFPSCVPAAGAAWCPTKAPAFRRTLSREADAALTAALRELVLKDALAEYRHRVGSDAESLARLADLERALKDPATDLWAALPSPPRAASSPWISTPRNGGSRSRSPSRSSSARRRPPSRRVIRA